MNTVIIERKMPGTGTIHDIASEHFDREIMFDDGDEYAIVLAAYYGNNRYYMAENGYSAYKIHERKKEFSHVIIDKNGRWVDMDRFVNEFAN